jgi:hypothetical protein
VALAVAVAVAVVAATVAVAGCGDREWLRRGSAVILRCDNAVFQAVLSDIWDVVWLAVAVVAV